MKRILIITYPCFVLFLSMLGQAHADIKLYNKTQQRVVYAVTQNPFADVREEIEMAIMDRGLVVNNVSHIGAMLSRTGKVLGATKPVYIKAEALEFCSAVVSRKMMEVNKHDIIFCPFTIFIYVLPKEPKTVYIAYRRPVKLDSNEVSPALDEVEKLIEGIIHDAED